MQKLGPHASLRAISMVRGRERRVNRPELGAGSGSADLPAGRRSPPARRCAPPASRPAPRAARRGVGGSSIGGPSSPNGALSAPSPSISARAACQNSSLRPSGQPACSQSSKARLRIACSMSPMPTASRTRRRRTPSPRARQRYADCGALSKSRHIAPRPRLSTQRVSFRPRIARGLPRPRGPFLPEGLPAGAETRLVSPPRSAIVREGRRETRPCNRDAGPARGNRLST